MREAETISIRSVQHYLYCPHRWGLLEIDRAWAENLFVTRANLLHERVHNPDRNYTARGKKHFLSVQIFNDLEPYQLFGVTDCLELELDREGVEIKGEEGKYRLRLVEYKPTKPENMEFRDDDLMQVFAQKICTDYVFGGDCDGAIYYANVKKRIPLPLRENFAEYDERLRTLLKEMRDYRKEGRIPPIRKGQNCSGCSLKDLCMPHPGTVKSMRAEIYRLQENSSDEIR